MKKGKMYGYVRVSSRDQNEDRQMIALSDYGVQEADIYLDKLSGKDFNRPAYQRMMKRMGEGDLLVIHSIDRLGRDYEEILAQWALITREKKTHIVVLDMPLLDTRQGKDLMGTLISDIVLQLLSYVAQTERESIRRRQAEGIRAAKARGIRFGRRRIEMPPEFKALKEQWLRGEISSREAGKCLGISYQTFLRNVKAEQR